MYVVHGLYLVMRSLLRHTVSGFAQAEVNWHCIPTNAKRHYGLASLAFIGAIPHHQIVDQNQDMALTGAPSGVEMVRHGSDQDCTSIGVAFPGNHPHQELST